ncbi:MAG: hypothetical protein KDC34_17605 [Saprospiraceae bacterium]|nr:hypothetical protein [Saprospiraceae bacterium]
MHHVTSNLTLLVKFFIPVFWVVFFGAFTIAVLASANPYFGNIPAFLFKVGVTLFYLTGLFLIWRFLFRLKRVEMDEEYLYATNYFKAYRYLWADVEGLEDWNMTILRFVRVKLKASGSFGKHFSFIVSKRRMGVFLAEYPEKANLFISE